MMLILNNTSLKRDTLHNRYLNKETAEGKMLLPKWTLLNHSFVSKTIIQTLLENKVRIRCTYYKASTF